MTLWIAAAVLTLLAVLLIGVPLWRGAGAGDTTGRRAYDMQVFRDQLAEVDNDEQEGLMSPDAAEAARTEIKRRMLAADSADAVRLTPGRSRTLAGVLIVIIPLAAFGTYAALGNPGMRDHPYAERDVGGESRTAAKGPSGEMSRQDVQAMVERLRKRLEENPDNPEGWRRLARAYTVMGRWQEAASAWQSRIDRTGGGPRAWAGLGEALVRGRDGRVPARAMVALARAMKAGAEDPRAPFYLGMGLAQNGRLRAAAGLWKATVQKAPEGASWVGTVKESIKRAADQLDTTPGAIEPATPDYDRIIAENRESADQEKAIDKKAAEMAQRVDAMLKRLRQAAEESPGDAAAWRRLGRAAMMGRRYDTAVEAFGRLVDLKPEAPAPRRLRARALLARAGWQGGDTPMPEAAVKAVTAALARGGTAPETLFLGGVAAQQKGDTATARKRLEKARDKAGPDSALGKAAADRLKTLGGDG